MNKKTIKTNEERIYTVINPFSKEEYTLTETEYIKYFEIKEAEMLRDFKTVRKNLDWFIKNNIEAYMVLLD